MIKTAIAAAAAAIALAPVAALAGPYVNVESNSGFVGSDYSSSILETHLGYEGELGSDAACSPARPSSKEAARCSSLTLAWQASAGGS